MNKSDNLFYAYNVSNNIISYNTPPQKNWEPVCAISVEELHKWLLANSFLELLNLLFHLYYRIDLKDQRIAVLRQAKASLYCFKS